jgi:hypothetical protein
MQVDTGSNEVMVDNTDMTGFFTSAFAMTNTFGTTAPTNVWLRNVTPGGSIGSGVLLNNGSNFRMEGADNQGCLGTGCAYVFVNNSFSGFASISGVNFHNGGAYGVLIGSGVNNVSITNNFVRSASTAAFAMSGSNNYIYGLGNNCVGATAGISGSPGANGLFPTGTGGNLGC